MKIVKSKKVASVVISAIIIAGGAVAVIVNQEEPHVKDNKSIKIEERVKPVIQPEINPVEKEVEVVEPVEEVQPTNQAQTFKPESPNNADDEDAVDEPVEKLYGTSFGYGCTKDQIFHVHATKFNESIIDLFKSNEVQQGYLWKDTASDRSHCSPNV